MMCQRVYLIEVVLSDRRVWSGQAGSLPLFPRYQAQRDFESL